MEHIENEVPKYKKKSNKTVKKSKHKHEYKDCLILDTSKKNKTYLKGSYCIECGKIGNIKLFECKEKEDGSRWSVMLSSKEIFEKYKHLEIKEVNGIFNTKYVGI